MIRSMTAFGSARAESEAGAVTVEFRTVNSRFLDVNLRLPDDLRSAEGLLREQLGQAVKRGKVDIRVNYALAQRHEAPVVDPVYLREVAQQLQAARRVIPDLAAPSLADLLKGAASPDAQVFDAEAMTALCQSACRQALDDLQANREREGRRLSDTMLQCAADISGIVDAVEEELPRLLAEHRDKLATRLREALEAAHPAGFEHISGAELSARISQETSLFSLRIDVAEEIARLRSHVGELAHLLSSPASPKNEETFPVPTNAARKKGQASSGSIGKRLDFLFQEMNREANTLGSKAGGLQVTRAAIDLKLLIEQLREQAQNIE